MLSIFRISGGRVLRNFGGAVTRADGAEGLVERGGEASRYA